MTTQEDQIKEIIDQDYKEFNIDTNNAALTASLSSPFVESLTKSKQVNGLLSFRLEKINVSLANALRRTIIADVPIIVMDTRVFQPHETGGSFALKDECQIFKNTTRLNNEIIKARLGCIPVYPWKEIMNDTNTGIQWEKLRKYKMRLQLKNTSPDEVIMVTSQHFHIYDVDTDKPIKENHDKIRDTIFPKNPITDQYIDLVRLRPILAQHLDGEEIDLECRFSKGVSRNDGMFNAACLCVYTNTIDEEKATQKRNEYEDELKKKYDAKDAKDAKEIEFQLKNFDLLDRQRCFVEDSFDFQIESVYENDSGCFFNNAYIVRSAAEHLMFQFKNIMVEMQGSHPIGRQFELKKSESTIPNSYDIVIENEDYTIGKCLEFVFYRVFFKKLGVLTYCGYKKFHPHDTHSVIRIAFSSSSSSPDEIMNRIIPNMIGSAAFYSLKFFLKIFQAFGGDNWDRHFLEWNFDSRNTGNMDVDDLFDYRKIRQITNPPVECKKMSHNNKHFYLFDDSICVGGTKQRLLGRALEKIAQKEIVYAGPASGFAQVALAFSTFLYGKTGTAFLSNSSDSKEKNILTEIAEVFGLKVINSGDSKPWSLRESEAAAKTYVDRDRHHRFLLPFGLKDVEGSLLYTSFYDALREAIDEKYLTTNPPKRLWVTAGSGFLLNILHAIWPNTTFLYVQVGKTVYEDQVSHIKNKIKYTAPENFAEDANELPPYDSVPWYDAKLWQFFEKDGQEGDFIWNVGAVTRNSLENAKQLYRDLYESAGPRIS